MHFFKHFKRLMSDLFGFARHNKIWWIIPLVVLLLMIGAFILVAQGTAPFIYTLF